MTQVGDICGGVYDIAIPAYDQRAGMAIESVIEAAALVTIRDQGSGCGNTHSELYPRL
jgi:hypothetical protein